MEYKQSGIAWNCHASRHWRHTRSGRIITGTSSDQRWLVQLVHRPLRAKEHLDTQRCQRAIDKPQRRQRLRVKRHRHHMTAHAALMMLDRAIPVVIRIAWRIVIMMMVRVLARVPLKQRFARVCPHGPADKAGEDADHQESGKNPTHSAGNLPAIVGLSSQLPHSADQTPIRWPLFVPTLHGSCFAGSGNDP